MPNASLVSLLSSLVTFDVKGVEKLGVLSVSWKAAGSIRHTTGCPGR